MPDAVDAIDQACRQHDQCYSDHNYFARACNVQLAADLVAVIRSPASSPQQRADAAAMAWFFAFEADAVDWRLRPTVDLWAAIAASLRSALGDLFQAGTTLPWLIEREIYHNYGVPR